MKASVVVVSYNSGAYIERCLEQLLAQEFDDYEVVLVDNASTDGSRERVVARFASDPRFRLVQSDVNLGCAGGRNLGIAESRGAIIGFVDSDAFAEPGWLAAVVLALAPARAGIAASRALYAANPVILNGIGGSVNLQGYGQDLGIGEPVEFFETPTRALFASGNGLTLKREVVDRVGDFDSCYFNYYEDVDLCLRARRAGYDVVLADDAVLMHVVGASDVLNHNKVFLSERNRVRTVLRHYPWRWLGRWLLRELRLDRTPLNLPEGTLSRAWLWNLSNVWSLLAFRLGPGRRLQPLDIDNLFHPTWGLSWQKAYNLALRPMNGDSGQKIQVGQLEGGLLYGWYYPEHGADGRSYRWSDGFAACILHLERPARRLTLECAWPCDVAAGAATTITVLNRAADLAWAAEVAARPANGWHRIDATIDLPPGEVEILIETRAPFTEPNRRPLGLGIRALELIE